ncbi:MAG TPA: hypothetical protein VMW40_05825, partial [Candidatus Bathyarchaeia archaeon]|nr:hypothetical protein [Candidatus Bathyarchaeia archaeon]
SVKMSFTENSDRWKQPIFSGGVAPTSPIMSLEKEKMRGGYTLYTIKTKTIPGKIGISYKTSEEGTK